MRKVKYWGAILILMAILIRPEPAVAGAQRAMQLWYSSVAPALFPFLALMPVLTGPDACAAYRATLSWLMHPIFNLPGTAAPALVIGMISGSPGGALAIRRIAAEGGLKKAEAQRLALALSGVSPAYLILGVGQGLYGSVQLGIRLALMQMAIQIGMLILLRGALQEDADHEGDLFSLDERANGAVRGAVESVLVICGYMVLFSSTCNVVASFVGKRIGTALLLISDLPSGLAELAHWEIPGRMLIQGSALGFGGLCIAAQNLDVLRPLGVTAREYFSARGVAATVYGCAAGFLLPAQGGSLETCLGNGREVYAVSLLAAGALMIPVLVIFTKTLCFNNPKRDG